MEPVTHMLTGAVLARSLGLNRRAAYATAAMAIAAEFPDIDVVWGYVGGPVVGFEHHRGITHTLLAIPFEAAFLTACFALAHRRRKKPPAAPFRWGWLFSGVLLALLSHILLDWTNNYGVRPFFPFNPRWYAGSFVFIFEPVLFALLVLGLLMPALFGLINQEVGERRRPFRGQGWAVFALVGALALWGWRWAEHNRAEHLAWENAAFGTTRVFANPHPINPFRWSLVADAPDAYRLLDVDTRRGVVLPPEPGDTVFKGPVTLPTLEAKRTFLGRVYLDWSMYPVITEESVNDDPLHPLVRVRFADARFMYNVLTMRGHDPPLGGSVLLDMQAPEGQRLLETRMGDKLQK